MPNNNNNQAAGTKKKKKGRSPAHQNSFAFKHNPKSKLTDKILSSPNVGVCQRCYEKIEWRKKYRKYKPLTQPKTCNKCKRRNIKAAYHTICNDCSFQYMDVEEKINLFENAQTTNEGDDDNHESNLDETITFKTNCFTNEEDDEIKKEKKQTKTTIKKRVRICSVCTKEPIMSSKTKEETIEEQRQQLESELIHEVISSSTSKRLTLRERKTIERKLEQKLDADTNSDIHNNNDVDDDSQQESEDQWHLHQNDICDNDIIHYDSNQNEDEEGDDPFLKAIGGKEKLLVGEQYQNMILSKDC